MMMLSSGNLPTYKDALHQHTKRANYQAVIGRRCLENSPMILDAADVHGWKVERDGGNGIEWITGTHAPDIIGLLVPWKCVRVCKVVSC
jgi:hypothetical protein